MLEVTCGVPALLLRGLNPTSVIVVSLLLLMALYLLLAPLCMEYPAFVHTVLPAFASVLSYHQLYHVVDFVLSSQSFRHVLMHLSWMKSNKLVVSDDKASNWYKCKLTLHVTRAGRQPLGKHQG